MYVCIHPYIHIYIYRQIYTCIHLRLLARLGPLARHDLAVPACALDICVVCVCVCVCLCAYPCISNENIQMHIQQARHDLAVPAHALDI